MAQGTGKITTSNGTIPIRTKKRMDSDTNAKPVSTASNDRKPNRRRGPFSVTEDILLDDMAVMLTSRQTWTEWTPASPNDRGNVAPPGTPTIVEDATAARVHPLVLSFL